MASSHPSFYATESLPKCRRCGQDFPGDIAKELPCGHGICVPCSKALTQVSICGVFVLVLCLSFHTVSRGAIKRETKSLSMSQSQGCFRFDIFNWCALLNQPAIIFEKKKRFFLYLLNQKLNLTKRKDTRAYQKKSKS